MNRAQRRLKARLERVSAEDAKRQLVHEAAEKAVKKLQRTEDDFRKEEDMRTITIYACSVLAVRRAFGFGQARCVKYLQAIDEIAGELSSGALTYDELCKTIEDEIGVIIDPREEER